MTTQLGDLLDEARRRTFVGRRHELANVDDALVSRSSAPTWCGCRRDRAAIEQQLSTV